MRVAEGAVRQTANGGFLHVLANANRFPASRGLRHGRFCLPSQKSPAGADYELLAIHYSGEASDALIGRFAASLGVSAASLRRLRIGWARANACWTFPMSDAAAAVVGIRLRTPSGRKFAVKGGRDGLFLPAQLRDVQHLLVCEGPTDTAAALHLGLDAVGRPSCTGGTAPLVQLVQRLRPQAVTIFGDSDDPGRRGAESLAVATRAYCRTVRVAYPLEGQKDLRAWVRAGATRAQVDRLIEQSPILALSVRFGAFAGPVEVDRQSECANVR